MKAWVCSEIGKVRKINEDSFFASKDGDKIPVFIVADGMGGHKAGDVASRLAVNSVIEYLQTISLESNSNDEIIQIIRQAFNYSNSKVFEMSLKDSNCQGMGTTLTMALIVQNCLYIGHIGDSRAYVYSGGKLIQLTQDHSLVAELVRNGKLTKNEARNHPQRNIITRALGTDSYVEVDIITRCLNRDDLVVLCSDGLTNMICDSELEQIICAYKNNVEKLPCVLTELANERGGYDNITVMVIENDGSSIARRGRNGR